jgi:mono/diheme cytochrome c family protein
MFMAVLSTSAFAGSSLVVTDELTRKECSACHMAYPPVFLPARSWEAITGNLKQHFGEDASLSPEDTAAIKTYLMANAADSSGKVRGFARGIPADQTPLRITELPRFLGEHGRFSPATIKKVGSLSNCAACHQGAEKGIFEDD